MCWKFKRGSAHVVNSQWFFFFNPEKMFEMVCFTCNHLRVILSGLPLQWNLSFCDSCFMRGVLLLDFPGLGPEICFLNSFSQAHGSRSLLGLKNSLIVKFSFGTLSLWVCSMPCFIARSVICSKRFFFLMYPYLFSCFVTFSGLNLVFSLPLNHNSLCFLSDWNNESQSFKGRTDVGWNQEVIA